MDGRIIVYIHNAKMKKKKTILSAKAVDIYEGGSEPSQSTT
jgi:hypothetical protein